MDQDWNDLEGVEAVERILGAALSSEAGEVHLSTDGDGATIFFLSAERIEFFRHIPHHCRNSVFQYLRTLGAIDEWQPVPVAGLGVCEIDGATFGVEVRIVQGSVEEDAVLKLVRER